MVIITIRPPTSDRENALFTLLSSWKPPSPRIVLLSGYINKLKSGAYTNHTTMQDGFEALILLPAVPHSNPNILLHPTLPHNCPLRKSESVFSKCEDRMDSTTRVKPFVVMEFSKQADLSNPPKRFWRTSWKVFTSRLINTDRGSTTMIICKN